MSASHFLRRDTEHTFEETKWAILLDEWQMPSNLEGDKSRIENYRSLMRKWMINELEGDSITRLQGSVLSRRLAVKLRVAYDKVHMSRRLKTCEEHSNAQKYWFALEKCVILSGESQVAQEGCEQISSLGGVQWCCRGRSTDLQDVLAPGATKGC